MKTTPPPPFDILQILPSLSGKEKITVRLHPRRDFEPNAGDSKLGGRFLWPEEEAWPTCQEPEVALICDYECNSFIDYSLGLSPIDIWSLSHPKHNDVYIGILQLKKEDFPEMIYPHQADLLQVLWCPRDHVYSNSPACRVYWRRRSDIVNALAQLPSPKYPEEDLVPNPCCLHPERVIEYPGVHELSDQEREKLYEWEEESEYSYEDLLSTAPGVKVGGYPRWIQDAEVPNCECGKEMEHLLTVASGEFEVNNAQRWCPLEDRSAWEERNEGALVQVAPGLIIGDCGSVYLFICRECADWPVESVFQC